MKNDIAPRMAMVPQGEEEKRWRWRLVSFHVSEGGDNLAAASVTLADREETIVRTTRIGASAVDAFARCVAAAADAPLAYFGHSVHLSKGPGYGRAEAEVTLIDDDGYRRQAIGWDEDALTACLRAVLRAVNAYELGRHVIIAKQAGKVDATQSEQNPSRALSGKRGASVRIQT